MARKLKSDKFLFIATLLLICTSVVMVYSASAKIAEARFDDPYRFLAKQAAWVLIGLALVPIVMRIDYRCYRQPSVIWAALGLVGFGLVAVLLGSEVNGAKRWLNFGPLGIQPSELAKIAVVFFIAALLERRMERIDDVGYSLLPIGVVTGAIVGLIIMQPDLGTAVSILVIAAAMVFAAGISWRYIAALAAVGLPALYIVMMATQYRRDRVAAFFDPWSEPLGSAYQMIQSMIAVGTGGVFGRGLMGGLQKLFYLPEPHNDFIYAVIAEELGLVGATAVLACFCVITWRGLRAATHAPDRFGTFLAIGITVMIAFQAFFNISVVLGLLPTKGIPLPFVSAGGSSLLVSLLGMAILLNIAQHASTPEVVTMTMAKSDA
jgi:cell division protein FtsW